MTIRISETADWKQLTDQGLETVVDPLVFRCGELFLKGARNTDGDAPEIWDLLNINQYAIGMFFDALILNQRLPVFNYGDTFDAELNFDNKVLTTINRLDGQGPVLHDVDVDYNAYHTVKAAALQELEKVFGGDKKVPAGMVKQISGEIKTSRYRWSPSLEGLEARIKSPEERLIANFLLGGLIFGGYAQQMESEHLLQPKRARLFIAMALQSEASGRDVETELFDELKKRSNSAVSDLPWRPTFFPYLLSKAETPEQMLKEVVKMRHSAEVRDYRQWFKEVTDDWKKNGRISREKRQDVKAIVQAVDYQLGTVSSMPKVEIKVKMALAIPGEVDVTEPTKRLWGWFLNSLPGRRYRKLLARAVATDNEYKKLENRIQTVWKNA